MLGDRRKANRGEMDLLVEGYFRQGLGAAEIVKRVYNIDRLLTYHGKKLEAQRVYVIKNKMTDRPVSEHSEEPKRGDYTSQSVRSDRSDRSDRSQRTAQSQQPEEPVRLEDVFLNFQDLPPRRKEGRRETRDYEKLNTTVDTALFKLFEEERLRRRWTATDLMELILFNTFGHPTLSYAEPDVQEPEPEESKSEVKRPGKGPGRTKS